MLYEASSRTLILCRIGELFLKGGNRSRFLRTLHREMRRQLSDLRGVYVRPKHLRIEVEAPSELVLATIIRLQRVFGLQSMSPATVTSPTIEAIRAEALVLARRQAAGTTFKVETNRRDKSFPMISPAVSADVGGLIADETELVVNVRNPEVVIEIEITADEAYLYGEVHRGPGGLPLGTGGRAALLLSGGIDSPVAAWSAMRRGLVLDAIYFHSFPYTGDKSKEKVLSLAALLARWHGPLAVWVVNFTEVQKELRAAGRADLAVLMYRRMMMRAGGLLAKRCGAAALVTGENLGQVASQTLENLGVIADASPLTVLRPLLCYDKTEIIARAIQIGTYDTSILPYDDCCSLFVPKHPATRARISDLQTAESGLDLAAMAASLADGAERIEVS